MTKSTIMGEQQNTTFLSCPICLNEYDDDTSTIVLDCRHKFHTCCILDWLDQDNSDEKCVICKQGIEKAFQNRYKLNFDKNAIIKYNYNMVFFHREPTYTNDMHLHYGDIDVWILKLKNRLMNSMPADIVTIDDMTTIPVYILKSSDRKFYEYISSYLRTLILFMPDSGEQENVQALLHTDNIRKLNDSFAYFKCVIDDDDNTLGYINRKDYLKYCDYMYQEINLIVRKYPRYATYIQRISGYTILSDMFMSNLRHLANTDDFIKKTTISDTNTQQNIDLYKKQIYHTIAATTIYAYMNMNGIENCKIYRGENDPIEILEEGDTNYFGDCHRNVKHSLALYITNRITNDMTINLFRGLINVTIDMNNYINHSHILPSINHLYYEILPKYSIKRISVISRFSDYSLIVKKGTSELCSMITYLMIVFTLEFYSYCQSSIYDIDITSNITKEHHHIKLSLLNIGFVSCSILMYININALFLIAIVNKYHFNNIRNYTTMTNVNVFSYNLKYDFSLIILIISSIIGPLTAIYGIAILMAKLYKLHINIEILDQQIENLNI